MKEGREFEGDNHTFKMEQSSELKEQEQIPEQIEYGKVRLERARAEHVPLLHELLSSKERIRYTEFSEEDRTIEGCQKIINGWGEFYPFVILDRSTGEPLGFDFLYQAECPYKKDPEKAREWEENNQQTFESGRVLKDSVHGYGTDTKKAIIIFAFHNLKVDSYTMACATENMPPINSGLRAGMIRDSEFQGLNEKGQLEAGINEEGFYDQFGKHCQEIRLRITREQFEKLEKDGLYDEPKEQPVI